MPYAHTLFDFDVASHLATITLNKPEKMAQKSIGAACGRRTPVLCRVRRPRHRRFLGASPLSLLGTTRFSRAVTRSGGRPPRDA